MPMKRLHVYYAGKVQGVGFRYTAQDIAAVAGISGWAKNLRDGRVEVVAEGEEEALVRFAKDMSRAMGRYIENADASWSESTGEFSSFEIRL